MRRLKRCDGRSPLFVLAAACCKGSGQRSGQHLGFHNYRPNYRQVPIRPAVLRRELTLHAVCCTYLSEASCDDAEGTLPPGILALPPTKPCNFAKATTDPVTSGAERRGLSLRTLLHVEAYVLRKLRSTHQSHLPDTRMWRASENKGCFILHFRAKLHVPSKFCHCKPPPPSFEDPPS